MDISIPRWLKASLLIVAFIGFLDAAYLTANHYSGVIPPCFIVHGCEVVTTSSYSAILGVPVALLGLIYYVGILALTLYYIDKKHLIALRLIHLFTFLGFLFTLWFLYVQGFIIHAWCMYCLGSATTSTILVILGALAVHKKWEPPAPIPEK